ncbi:6-hydroxymethylpterin diphosphokinase MptE-like protein [Methylomarinum sp. Ch1-1]|uniref:6-hydroxymethylpterin diphosphokinase MptE-like protein n=1 Tax=Methylomarinum roseum TaxID=3067653 RepID=A0AAU7NVJ8_9GAMM|nr:6-hydroxymethylpterin diphosphokinase MptE-like protein [Methylomarinum sp. Ch1-1]MDP4522944.1 DUF115 domain-containing protein [Methylomarinum sp. Ch1-1]
MTLLISKFPRFRKFITRIKRWQLRHQYRHMAKISRHLKIDSMDVQAVYWKKQHICSLIPFSQINNSLLGETAFIVASGPSLKSIDIKPLTNKYTFGVNGSILKFVDADISPTFYVISDEEFIYNRPQLLRLILKNSESHCFFTPQAITAICEIDVDLLKGHQKITLFNNHFKDYGKAALEFPDIVKMAHNDPEIITEDGKIGFSLNPEKGVFTAHTVPYFALQIAYGLGFRTINIAGMDLGSPSGETRFYEQGSAAMPSHLDRDYLKSILPSFEIVSQLCKNKTLQVFNLSPNSRLPDSVIPKKSFADAIRNH